MEGLVAIRRLSKVPHRKGSETVECPWVEVLTIDDPFRHNPLLVLQSQGRRGGARAEAHVRELFRAMPRT